MADKSHEPAESVSATPPELRAGTGYLLTRLGAESRRRWARMLTEHGMTPHHYGALMTLEAVKVTHQQHLAELIGVDPRNAVSVVDFLERRGLIERTRDPADRRRHTIRLTAEGRATAGTLRRAGEVIERDMLAGLTGDERTSLHALLQRLFEVTVDR
ncbi:MarR family winged helix-turn-helix transcriptional regulator [Actinoallomurus rhizosphaericola]|uniref:MarR family winged helix-turn-helix transcriptional regulator n=1 Tax=Actinoallomurus rhizosphaericola TaxID=2952536 RepID=UPI002090F31A|nr:MarR family winged helix-turn-helix transcriptional regulator [Actinoallomurus rhizosphaericola]MCO5992574.1 MarR family winged helix-turn-helix transcriptional regulator [Actinoallomurus rhizosphaericola]